jgi:xanthine dehydrogenase molybdopterin-binding subunit B
MEKPYNQAGKIFTEGIVKYQVPLFRSNPSEIRVQLIQPVNLQEAR